MLEEGHQGLRKLATYRRIHQVAGSRPDTAKANKAPILFVVFHSGRCKLQLQMGPRNQALFDIMTGESLMFKDTSDG